MRRTGVPLCIVAILAAGGAYAAECPGHPDAIGTSRTIYVDPTEHTRVGTMQYHETLPLNDHEVVLTFDDGPLPPKTTHVLDILASECVKATFFSVGKMAQTYPATLRREFAEGHSIGTHTQDHPLNFQRAPLPTVETEVDEGIASVSAALGDPKDVAPFFRIPGLLREQQVEDFLTSRGLMIWSADFPADDWKHIRPQEVYRRALSRIEARHKGVLLLHDIQPATVAALPMLLKELKRRGYHIVHVAPATAEQPKTATEPSQWLIAGKKTTWSPEVVSVEGFLNGEATKPAANPATPEPSTSEQSRDDSKLTTLALRGPIPLPPRRPRPTGERSAIIMAPLPAPSARDHGSTNVPMPPSTDADLRTGSIGAPAKPASEDDPVLRGQPILRPSADIPTLKPPGPTNAPKAGIP